MKERKREESMKERAAEIERETETTLTSTLSGEKHIYWEEKSLCSKVSSLSLSLSLSLALQGGRENNEKKKRDEF